jgi:hypothetical protein
MNELDYLPLCGSRAKGRGSALKTVVFVHPLLVKRTSLRWVWVPARQTQETEATSTVSARGNKSCNRKPSLASIGGWRDR